MGVLVNISQKVDRSNGWNSLKRTMIPRGDIWMPGAPEK